MPTYKSIRFIRIEYYEFSAGVSVIQNILIFAIFLIKYAKNIKCGGAEHKYC
jgi:hypothetical protein